MSDLGGLAELLTPAGMQLVDSLPAYSDTDSLSLGARLRAEGHSPALVAEALTQSRLRAAATEKFGPFAARMLFTQTGLEQATRLSIAAHHAARFRDAGAECVADLGCGLGGDTIAKAGLGLRVIGVDTDPTTVALATVNTSIFDSVSIELGRAEDFDLSRVDAAWFDPARRDGHGRIHDPEKACPPLSVIVQAARELGGASGGAGANGFGASGSAAAGSEEGDFGPVGAKLAPAINHADLVPGTETQWVSWNGQVLEACAWFGPLARTFPGLDAVVPRSALVIERDSTETAGETGAVRKAKTAGASGATGAARAVVLDPHVDPAVDDDAVRTPAVGDLADYVVEPDGAVIRAGLLGTYARQIGAHTIDPTIAYLSSTRVPNDGVAPLGRAFQVEEVLPLHTKKIAQYLKARGVGILEVKKRGVDVDPARLRTQLRLEKKAAGRATLIATRLGGQRVAIVAQPV